MRKLNAKQKKLLLKYVGRGLYCYAVFPIELQDELEKLNDYETMWSDAVRFLNDEDVKARMAGR